MLLDMRPIISDGKTSIDFDIPLQKEDCAVLTELYPDVQFDFPIRLVGQVKNMAGYMVLKIDADIKFTTPCARCAEPADYSFALSLEKSIATGDTSRDNDDYIFIEDMKLDIATPTLEEIIFHMPSRVLCREDCRGLCPRCGKNLNEGDCDCKKTQGDPRLAILRSLLEKDDPSAK
ncbi:MAG: DUF177 domain-containing protein [Clostridia bacterium]|nr:DUF177 domain-containing protein [Clostridia bacterium]